MSGAFFEDVGFFVDDLRSVDGNISPSSNRGRFAVAAAWARLTSASNWNVVANSGFDNVPIWGIVPRGFGGT
ncbi:MAG TPA: hypothetical protein VI565_11205 [Burkholderiales bacterium]|nr:hypothetical protein [Burkholderiales bacterium]